MYNKPFSLILLSRSYSNLSRIWLTLSQLPSPCCVVLLANPCSCYHIRLSEESSNVKNTRNQQNKIKTFLPLLDHYMAACSCSEKWTKPINFTHTPWNWRISNGQKKKPVWIKIFIVFLSRLVISMIPSNLVGVAFIPVKPLPVFPKLVVQLHVLLAPRLVLLSFTNHQNTNPNHHVKKGLVADRPIL